MQYQNAVKLPLTLVSLTLKAGQRELKTLINVECKHFIVILVCDAATFSVKSLSWEKNKAVCLIETVLLFLFKIILRLYFMFRK